MTRRADRLPKSYCLPARSRGFASAKAGGLAVAALEVLALALGLLLATARPAAAGMVCNERGDVIEELAKKFGEVPVAVAIENRGGLVEVLTSDGGDTWTIIVTTPDGTSCLVAAGRGWRRKFRIQLEPKV